MRNLEVATFLVSLEFWQEGIKSLQKMMERALGKFIELRKIPPRRVTFFQDGVLEGEYNTMATAEFEAIQGKFWLFNTCA
jgi:Piwi domain